MLDLSNHQKRKVLFVDNDILRPATANGRASTELLEALEEQNVKVLVDTDFEDAISTVCTDASICCIFVNWTANGNDKKSHQQALELLQDIRRHNKAVPVLLMADRSCVDSLDADTMRLVNEFVWMKEDTAEFIVARARTLVERYYSQLLPPFTNALFHYTRKNPEYSWAVPGHQGGIAFTKSAVGREFLDFYGENLFRSDFGIEREELGSLLDHSGPIKASEAYAAKVFGADESYSVINGTSGSNRTLIQAIVGEREVALCDRNCHKSVLQGMVMSGALPVYLIPSRNRYGIIGPIPKSQFEPEKIRAAIKANPLINEAVDTHPVYAVVTNCTYDGMCYNAEAVEKLLAKSVDQIHFDEAWYAYARFNPMYAKRYAMRGDPKDFDRSGPTVFSTMSTHKLLAALSQASYIHVRNGKKPVNPSRFNESYNLQATTSPFYPLIAANEIGAAMMDNGQGLSMTQAVINEAVDFRLALGKAHHSFASKGEWFFQPWNAPEITGKHGKKVPFHLASKEQLASDPSCWTLEPGQSWHGFDHLVDDWCMLDPSKVGILCPGMAENGDLLKSGIPAPMVTAYLAEHDIVPSRTTDFMVLCLFAVGITKGKWGTMINVLLSFKTDYDNNTALDHCLPGLIKRTGNRYRGMGLKDLCDEMFNHMKTHNMDKLQSSAFGQLPTPVYRPRLAFQQHMAGKSEQLPISELANRISAVGVIPYPPGIPIVLPGENFGPADGPWLKYIQVMVQWDERFPGFEKELQGAEMVDGSFKVWVLKE